MKTTVWMTALLAALLPPLTAARKSDASPPAAPKALIARFTQESIRLDGVLDEAVWQEAGASDFVQCDPLDGAAPTEMTRVWVAYDREALYVAARLDESEPERIVAPLARRDSLAGHGGWMMDSDWFVFSVDPYHDHLSGFHFAVNPAGTVCDATLSNDSGQDYSWDGVWDWRTHRDNRGWTVELRIPFDQLRFADSEEQEWGVNFRRIIKRRNETDSYVWIPKSESGYVSHFARLTGLKGIRRRLQVELMPYGVARAAFTPAQAGNPFLTGHEYRGNAGLDLKVGLKSNLTLDATVNPDFGQVEVDPAVVNLTAYETFYDEKRPFFIEGASIFDFGRGGASSYYSLNFDEPGFFYSRRIGRSPQGPVGRDGFVRYPESTTILGAAKLSGKIGAGWNLGLLSALTSRETAEVDAGGIRFHDPVEPLAGYGVLRAQKEFDRGRQGLGFLATGVIRDLNDKVLAGLQSRQALTLGMDGWSFLGKSRTWVATGWFGLSRVGGDPEAILGLQTAPQHYFQRPDAGHRRLDPEATSLSGWAGKLTVNKEEGHLMFNAALAAVSPGFETNDLGYMTRADVLYGHLVLGYRWFTPGKVFRNAQLQLAKGLGYDFDGNRTSDIYYLTAYAVLLNYWDFSLSASYSPGTQSNDLTWGGPLMFHPAFRTVSFHWGGDSRKKLVLEIAADYNRSQSGAYNGSAEIEARWKPVSNLSLSFGPEYAYRYSLAQYVGAQADPLMTATYGQRYLFSSIRYHEVSADLRLNWTFTPRLSLQLYLQPYIAVGAYSGFKELARPRRFDFNRYGENGSTIRPGDGDYLVDPDGSGPAPAFAIADPDFNYKSLRGTAVLRWEYRPGSTLFFVWTQVRTDWAHPGDFDFGRDLGDMLTARGDNVFMVKFSHRFKI